MSIQKKSLINSRTATQRAIIASTRLVAPVVSNKPVSASKVMAAKTAMKVSASKTASKFAMKAANKTAMKTASKFAMKSASKAGR